MPQEPLIPAQKNKVQKELGSPCGHKNQGL
jgi:hypothetical protein